MKHTLDTDTQIFFYEQDHYYLSNFSSFGIHWCDLYFPTSEHAYQWAKYFPITAWPYAIRIHQAESAHEAFKLGERFKEHRRADWLDVRINIMRELLYAKVQQHDYIHRKLLETGDRELIENSWRDDYWGWGENRDGQNMLGKLWMEVRAQIRSEYVSNQA